MKVLKGLLIAIAFAASIGVAYASSSADNGNQPVKPSTDKAQQWCPPYCG